MKKPIRSIIIGLSALTLGIGTYEGGTNLYDAYDYQKTGNLKSFFKNISGFLDVHGNVCGKGDDVRLTKEEIKRRCETDKDFVRHGLDSGLQNIYLGGKVNNIRQCKKTPTSGKSGLFEGDIIVGIDEPEQLGGRHGSEPYENNLEKGNPLDKDYLDMVQKMIKEYRLKEHQQGLSNLTLQ